jgi:hypothetical protein
MANSNSTWLIRTNYFFSKKEKNCHIVKNIFTYTFNKSGWIWFFYVSNFINLDKNMLKNDSIFKNKFEAIKFIKGFNTLE